MLIPMLRNKNIVHKKKKIIDDNNLNFYQKIKEIILYEK